MLSRISIPIMYLCRSLHTGPVADGSSCSDGPVADVFVVVVFLVVDVVACVIDVVCTFWSLLLACSLLSLFHGQIIIASTRICDPSYFKRLHLWTLIIFQSSRVTEPTHSPVFIAPPHSTISKNGVFIHKQALFTDFRPFFARSWVKYQPNRKQFSFSDSLQQALQHCRSKFVASQTSLHENNYWNFFTGESVSVR